MLLCITVSLIPTTGSFTLPELTWILGDIPIEITEINKFVEVGIFNSILRGNN